MELYGYLFFIALASTFLSCVVALTFFGTKRFSRNGKANRTVAQICFALTILFGGLVVLVTLVLVFYFRSNDIFDWILSLTPLLVSALVSIPSFISINRAIT
jgi:hypothetical protein